MLEAIMNTFHWIETGVYGKNVLYYFKSLNEDIFCTAVNPGNNVHFC